MSGYLSPFWLVSASGTPGNLFATVSSGASAFSFLLYTLASDALSVTDDISGMSLGVTGQIDISDDGVYLVKACNQTSGSGSILLAKKTSGVWSVITSPTYTIVALAAAFSPGASYLAVGFGSAPRLRILGRSGDTFSTGSITISADTAQQVNEICWRPDGNYLVAGCIGSVPFYTYSRSGDAFTRMSNPASLPSSAVNGCTYSPDGTVLLLATTSSPFLYAYSFDGTTCTQLSGVIDTAPTGQGNKVKFSRDGTKAVVAHATSPYVTVYSVSGTGGSVTLTKMSMTNLPPGTCSSAEFDSTGGYLAVSYALSGGYVINLYKLVSGTWSRIQRYNFPTGSAGPTTLFWDKDR